MQRFEEQVLIRWVEHLQECSSMFDQFYLVQYFCGIEIFKPLLASKSVFFFLHTHTVYTIHLYLVVVSESAVIAAFSPPIPGEGF